MNAAELITTAAVAAQIPILALCYPMNHPEDPPREPLPVELLIDSDQRRLETATSATRPLPAGELEELIAEIRRYRAEGGGVKR